MTLQWYLRYIRIMTVRVVRVMGILKSFEVKNRNRKRNTKDIQVRVELFSFSKHNCYEKSATRMQTSRPMRQLQVISSLVKRRMLFSSTWDFAFRNSEQNLGPRI